MRRSTGVRKKCSKRKRKRGKGAAPQGTKKERPDTRAAENGLLRGRGRRFSTLFLSLWVFCSVHRTASWLSPRANIPRKPRSTRVLSSQLLCTGYPILIRIKRRKATAAPPPLQELVPMHRYALDPSSSSFQLWVGG